MNNQELPFISVILPVFNEECYIEKCLTTLRKNNYPKDRYEVITIDNGSTDDSLNIARQYADNALYLPNANVGAVRNFGVKHSNGEILVFLDSDCLVPGNWLILGVELLSSSERSVYGGHYKLREEPFWIEKFWLLDKTDTEISKCDLLGGCIFIPKEAFIEAGEFDESITSGEDSALSHTLTNMGYKVIVDARIGVIHLGNPITISDFVKRQIWHSENYVKTIAKSLGDKMFWLVLIYSISLIGMLMSPFYSFSLILFFTPIVIFAPALLSLKRLVHSNYKINSMADLAGIYLVDNLYLVGRMLGLFKGLYKSVANAC